MGGKKRKRKRSFRSAGIRLVSLEKISKQAVHRELSAKTMLQPLPAQSFEFRASRMVEIHNMVKSSLITHIGTSTESNIENESAPQLRDGITIAEIASEVKNKADGNVKQVLDSSSGADMACEQAVNNVKSTSFSVPMSSTVCASKLSHLVADHKELLVAANSARNSSYRACSNLFWKKMECYFAPISPQDESYLKNQLEFADALSGSLYQMPGNKNSDLDNLKLQQYPMLPGGGKRSLTDQGSIETAALAGSSGITETLDEEAPSLFGRVLSALIEEDESQPMSLEDYNIHDFYCASDDPHCGSSNSPMLSVKDKLLLELQKIDLCPETHHIAEGQHTIDQEISRLQAELTEKAQKSKKCLEKIYEAIQYEKEAEKRNLEQAALSELTEMAYKNQMVSRSGVLRKFSEKFALPFAKRTLARWRDFEDTGRSCFNEADLQKALFSTPTFNSNLNTVDKDANRRPNRRPRSSGSLAQQHLETDPEVLLNDVNSAAPSKAISLGNVKRKRSEGANDDSDKNITKKSVRRVGRPPKNSSIYVYPSTLKPKVKARYLVASNDAPAGSKNKESKHAASRLPHASTLSRGVVSEDMRKKKEQPNMKKRKNRVNPSAEELMGSGLSEFQVFNSMLAAEIESMRGEVMLGLDVPMDDLKDVQFFI